MALSLLCGGLGVASAADGTVNVDESTPGTAVVYTKEGTESYVQGELSHYAKASDTFTKSQTFTQDQVRKLINDLKTGDVATNRADITALQSELGNKADKSTVEAALDGKANKADVYSRTEVDTAVANAVTTAGTNVDNKLTDYYNMAAVDGKIAAEATARDTAINTAITLEKDARRTAIETAINGEVGARNQAIHTAITQEVTARDLAVTNAKTELQGKITEEETARKAADVELTGKITAEETARTNADNALDNRLTTAEGKIGANETAIGDLKAKDTVLEGKITTLDGKVTTDIADLKAKDIDLEGKIQTNENNIQTNKNDITTIKQRTAGIDRIDARHETTIEGHVTVDDHGNVTADGKLKAGSVDAGTGDITTTGAVNAGSLNVTDASHLKGDVTMDKTLSVTGDTSLGALNVTGESSLKNTQVNGTLTTTGKATFKEAVDMDKGLTVTSGDTTLQNTDVKGALNVTGESNLKNTTVDGTLSVNKETTLNDKLTANGEATFGNDVTVKGTTNLKNTTVDGDLKVTGTITTDKMVFGDKPTNYTEIDHGKVTSKNLEVNGAGQAISSSSTFDVEKNEVGFGNGITGDHSYHKQTAKGINGSVTDKDGNKTYTKVTATENSFQVQDKDGKNKNHQVNTKDSSVTEIKNAAGATTKTEQTAENITNTAQNGTITNDAMNIVNNASGNMTNTVGGNLSTTVGGNEIHEVKGTKTETVEGKVTENFKNGQETNVTGNQDIHVTGKQTNTVGGGQENIISGGQTNTITGGQINNITGDQTTNVSGTQTTTATDINRNASSGMVDKVDNAYGTNTETKEAGKTTTDVSIKGTGEKGQYIRGANESRDYLINGTLKNSETKTVEKTSTEITDGNGKTSATIQDVNNLAGSVTNGTETGVSGIHANDNSVSIDSIVTDGNKYSVINQKKGSIQSTVVDGTNSTVILQDKDNVTIASSNGTVAIGGKDIVNNAQDTITNTAGTKITDKVGTNTRVIDSTSITDTVGTANRKIEDGKITDTAGDSTVTTENGKGTTFAKAGSAAYSTEAGATKDTNIAGNHITTGRVNANELAVSDKDGDNTADFSVKAGEGVKASAGNGTTTGSLDVTAEEVTTSIKSGSKENTVISTVDGTSFINSEAAAPVTGASGANPGTADRTTIKGNTITTGKVTMDYAEVMKDLGVRGNANITGKTTTGSLEVTGTSTLKGDVTMESNATVNGNFSVGGNTNLKNTEVDGTLNVTQKATFGDSVSIAKDLSVGGDVTANSYKVGDKTYIDANGIHANGQKITDVADGSISEGSKDAVNGGQLYGVKRDLEHQVDKVGANAAAMANLRPMEFDPSSKWNIAAAIGNYGSETAAAIGAFYRPNDDVMVNLSTAFGTGENMVGGGVSVRLGKGGNKLSREENNALKDQVNDLTARMDALLSVLNPNMSKDFPDVPENHWAYEAVSRLAGNDIVQGYPDGEFHGERTMTRYEMAEIIYNALSRGAEAERELVEEFKPELQAMAASEKATAEKAEG